MSDLRFTEVYESEHGDIMADYDEEMLSLFDVVGHAGGYSIITLEELADQNYAEYERLKDLLDED
tara:strand:+ start:51 stop:245 length:195 start_codon:yes stop_codon:yes gene_type:complete